MGATCADIAYQRGRNEPTKRRGRQIYIEVSAVDRERSHYSGVFAQRHPLQKRARENKRGREEERRRVTPKTNQTGRDGIRGPPGATTDGFTPVHTGETVGEFEVQIASPSGLHPRNGKPPQWSGGGGAAALTLCYDKYIFLFVLLIRPLADDTNPAACHRSAHARLMEETARESVRRRCSLMRT